MIAIGTDFFDPVCIAESGQMFRFSEKNGAYTFFSKNDAAKIVKSSEKYDIMEEYRENPCRYEMDSSDDAYFSAYFDLGRDYADIRRRLGAFPQMEAALGFGRGLRILRQDPYETLIGFLISQNNHIPRIRGIVERLCERLGEEREFRGERYFGFPSAERMAAESEDFYREIGAGYRAPYLAQSARLAADTDFAALAGLPDAELGEALLSFPGVGPKVRDCILLFGFGRESAFPVDTWIEKVYHQSFGGRETDRRKITGFFEGLFGEDSGYAQQLLFYQARKTKNKIGGQPI